MNRKTSQFAKGAKGLRTAPAGLERRVLDRIQNDFPLDPDPYGALAVPLGTPRDAVHAATLRLREAGVIRRIGASYVPARLGHVSALVAAQVDPAGLDAAAATASRFPEVTHNYQRDGSLNLWFTVIAENRQRQADIVGAVAASPGVHRIQALPALRTFKIRVNFQFDDALPAPVSDGSTMAAVANGSAVAAGFGCDNGAVFVPDALDKRLIARTCGDLGVALHPFTELAAALGTAEATLLHRLRSYRDNGVLRRFGAILRHQAAGIEGNAMVVWNVPEARREAVGTHLAACPEASHVYERPCLAEWPYNLYTMIHARDRDTCRALVTALAAQIDCPDFRFLFSEREFKKTSMVYFA